MTQHAGPAAPRRLMQQRCGAAGGGGPPSAGRRRTPRWDDPQRRLAQGWAVVTTNGGDVVRSVDDVTEGGALRIRVRDGQLGATVTSKERSDV